MVSRKPEVKSYLPSVNIYTNGEEGFSEKSSSTLNQTIEIGLSTKKLNLYAPTTALIHLME